MHPLPDTYPKDSSGLGSNSGLTRPVVPMSRDLTLYCRDEARRDKQLPADELKPCYNPTWALEATRTFCHPRSARRVVTGNEAREDNSRSQAPQENFPHATDDAPEETDFVWMEIHSSGKERPRAETTLRNSDHQMSQDCAVREARTWC